MKHVSFALHSYINITKYHNLDASVPEEPYI